MMSDSNFLQANVNPPAIDPNDFNYYHGSSDNLPGIIEDYHRNYPSSEVSSYISYVNHFLNDDSPRPAAVPPPAAVVTQERSCTTTTTTTGSSCSSFDGMPPPSSSPQSQMMLVLVNFCHLINYFF